MAKFIMPRICVVGLGYVGLPLALELSKYYEGVVGFDLKSTRVAELNKAYDSNNEHTDTELDDTTAKFTDDATSLHDADFIIVTVPTPITTGNKPDLQPLYGASKLIGQYADFRKKPTIVYESTVYPGVTEEFCVPIIEEFANNPGPYNREGNIKCGVDFFVGYSPERVNPGDKVHTVSTITKVVSGMDEATLNFVDSVYSSITKTHRASSIKVAEAAKVIENSQRDLNIAFVNELALIFDKLGIDTLDVLEAAGTKWNFLNFRPGLVGGHCISVDPYYLTYRAEGAGIISQVILAGRHVNDSMPHHVVNLITRTLNNQRRSVKGSTILILGATFKENCKDVRNSKIEDIILELEELGATVYIHDPYYEGEKIDFHRVEKQGIRNPLWVEDANIVLYAVPHDVYKNEATMLDIWERHNIPVIDLKGVLGKKPNVIRI